MSSKDDLIVFQVSSGDEGDVAWESLSEAVLDLHKAHRELHSITVKLRARLDADCDLIKSLQKCTDEISAISEYVPRRRGAEVTEEFNQHRKRFTAARHDFERAARTYL